MGTERRNRVVVITGASAGVGRATARAFARQGASIGLLARGQAGLEGAKRDVEQAGGRAVIVKTDVSDAEQVESAATQVENALGPIDIWVNNAMVSVFAPADEITPDEYRRVMDVIFHGYVHGTLTALRRMRPRNRGTIIQVGSALAYRGIPLQAPYCAAKHAIQGFTDSLRAELLHDKVNIHVTHVHLPAVNTPQFGWVRNRLGYHGQPVPPIFQPELAADAIAWAADNNRREVYVGFSAAKAIMGDKIFPAIGDRYLAQSGYEAQMTDQPYSVEEPDNLFTPLDDETDHGARGAFSDKARNSSWYMPLVKNRNVLTVAATALLSSLALLVGTNQVKENTRA
jgi:NAD(P)-dependent dehydrogenase (short-subunit alcohol dehydrogenase family)